MNTYLVNGPGWITAGALGLVMALTTLSLPPAPAPLQTLRQLYGLPTPDGVVAPRTALVLVDFQQEFFTGRLPLPGGAAAAAQAARLVSWAHAAGILVVHVQNIATRPGSLLFADGAPTTQIIPSLAPGPRDLVITKHQAGAFSRTELDARLRGRAIDTVIIAGLMTHLAVTITASDAAVLGYRAIVVADATATRSLPGAAGTIAVTEAELQRAALAALADRVAEVLTSEQVTNVKVTPR
jgi:nicotinamidase-related amidase